MRLDQIMLPIQKQVLPLLVTIPQKQLQAPNPIVESPKPRKESQESDGVNVSEPLQECRSAQIFFLR